MEAIFSELSSNFHSGLTRPLSFRRSQLMALQKLLIEGESRLCEAVHKDMNKLGFEQYLIDIQPVLSNISVALTYLESWTQPQAVPTPLALLPGSSTTVCEPRGVVLVIGPWNANVFSSFGPLVGAIAAGCAAIVKPGEFAKNLAKTMVELMNEFLDPRVYRGVFGGPDVTKSLLADCSLDLVFFTGSTMTGRLVYQKAAEKLIPCVLELGGKSPCVFDTLSSQRSLEVAVKRLVWGAFTNGGQICIRPDYVMVPKELLGEVVRLIRGFAAEFYGDLTKFTHIVNEKHAARVSGLIEGSRKFCETLVSPNTAAGRLIPPTLVNFGEDFSEFQTSELMKEEVFGPVLVLVAYRSINEAMDFIQNRSKAGHKPLAAYLFSENREMVNNFRSKITAGSLVINDCLVQNGNVDLPFGGVGESGLGGKFQGKAGFDVFSHSKSILHKSLKLDIPFRYPPYGEKLLRFFFRSSVDRCARTLRTFSSPRLLAELLLIGLLLYLLIAKKK